MTSNSSPAIRTVLPDLETLVIEDELALARRLSRIAGHAERFGCGEIDAVSKGARENMVFRSDRPDGQTNRYRLPLEFPNAR